MRVSDVRDNLAKNLKKLRADRHLTQEQLAEILKVDPLTIRNYETKRRWPDPDKIEAIARALGIHESFLFLDNAALEQRLADTPSPEVREALADPGIRTIMKEVIRIRRENAALPRDLTDLWAQLDEVDRNTFLRQMRMLVQKKASSKTVVSKE